METKNDMRLGHSSMIVLLSKRSIHSVSLSLSLHKHFLVVNQRTTRKRTFVWEISNVDMKTRRKLFNDLFMEWQEHVDKSRTGSSFFCRPWIDHFKKMPWWSLVAMIDGKHPWIQSDRANLSFSLLCRFFSFNIVVMSKHRSRRGRLLRMNPHLTKRERRWKLFLPNCI